MYKLSKKRSLINLCTTKLNSKSANSGFLKCVKCSIVSFSLLNFCLFLQNSVADAGFILLIICSLWTSGISCYYVCAVQLECQFQIFSNDWSITLCNYRASTGCFICCCSCCCLFSSSFNRHNFIFLFSCKRKKNSCKSGHLISTTENCHSLIQFNLIKVAKSNTNTIAWNTCTLHVHALYYQHVFIYTHFECAGKLLSLSLTLSNTHNYTGASSSVFCCCCCCQDAFTATPMSTDLTSDN